MGDIRRVRKKYETPTHPWNRERIDQEKIYKNKYGLKNKKEIWKANTILKNIKNQIKEFPSLSPERAELLEGQLRGRLMRMGLIQENSDLGDVLGFDTDVILERRLQTIVEKKGLARSINQARQMIGHEHISVGGKTINAPGYLVTVEEEQNIEFRVKSAFISEDHPERIQEEKPVIKKAKEEQPQEEQPELVELKPEDDIE